MEYEKQMDELQKIYDDSTAGKIESSKSRIFDIILNQNGSLEFDKLVFINSYKIKKIFVSSFHEQMNIHESTEHGWNSYIQRLKNSVKSENYHTPVIKNNKIIGTMKFLDKNDKEIKMDKFEKKWIDLLDVVYKQQNIN